MGFPFYDGTTLLSLSYCSRKLTDLYHQSILAHNLTSSCNDYKVQAITENISFYRKVKEELTNMHKNLDGKDLMNLILPLMIQKIDEAHSSQIFITFSYVSSHTLKFTIKKACSSHLAFKYFFEDIFSTEVTFKDELYSESWYPSYNGLPKYTRSFIPTYFCKKVKLLIENTIHSSFPNILLFVEGEN